MGLITAGVAVAATAAAAIAKKRAADKAGKARETALNGLKLLDIPEIDKAAAKADEASYKGRLDLQKRVDPNSAAARDSGLKALTENIESPNDAKSLGILDRIQAGAEDPEMAKLQQELIQDARTSLAAGATLPPEYQAELVRSGLEMGNTAGLTPDAKGAAGTTLRRLTGTAGLALEEQRKQAAVRSSAAAQTLASAKAAILGNIVPQIQSITGAKTDRANAAFQAGASQTPGAYGLTGADTAGLMVANTNTENSKTLGLGEVQANKALARGEMIGGIAGGVSGAATGLIGGYAKDNPNSWLAKWG